MSRASVKGGRPNGSPHVRLDHSVFHSSAYRALGPVERSMLLEIVGLHNGSNNGNLWVGVRDAARLLGVADPKTASRAIHKLIAHGFLAVTTPGAFALKERHATCYRITFLHTNGAAPTNEWRDYAARAGTAEAARLVATSECNLRSAFSTLTVGKIYTDAAIEPDPRCSSVGKIPTGSIETKGFSPGPSVGNMPTQILCHTLGPEKASSEACKKAAGLARSWIKREGLGAQGRLAGLASIHASKLSRFLKNHSGKQTLTTDQVERLTNTCLQSIARLGKREAA